MRTGIKLFLATAAMLLCLAARAATDSYDVFVPISKYLSQGNADALSAWFSETLDISVLSKGGISRKGNCQRSYVFCVCGSRRTSRRRCASVTGPGSA